MTTMTLAQAASRIQTINTQISQLTDEKHQLEDHVRTLIPEGETREEDGYTITVRTGARRLDTKKLAVAYPATRNPEYYKPTIDIAAVKRMIPTIVLEQDGFYTVSTPGVTIK